MLAHFGVDRTQGLTEADVVKVKLFHSVWASLLFAELAISTSSAQQLGSTNAPSAQLEPAIMRLTESEFCTAGPHAAWQE